VRYPRDVSIDRTTKDYEAWMADGTLPTGATRVLAETPVYDHCNFTVGPKAPPAAPFGVWACAARPHRLRSCPTRAPHYLGWAARIWLTCFSASERSLSMFAFLSVSTPCIAVSSTA